MQYTREDLVNVLKTIYNAEQERDEVKNIKYIIYARKSSESEERQVQSLGDQVTECRKKLPIETYRFTPKNPFLNRKAQKNQT